MNKSLIYLGAILFETSICFAQNDNKLIKAQDQYRDGNFENSLELLHDIPGMPLQQEILRKVLTAENALSLHYPEDTIHAVLISIYKSNPTIDFSELNVDLSDAFQSRLKTIRSYPEFKISLEGTINYIFPRVRKEPHICNECVVSDHYRYSGFYPGVNLRAAFLFKPKIGIELGIGYNSAEYSRLLIGKINKDSYSISYSEKLKLLDFPVRMLYYHRNWSYKAGLNYKYLLDSNAKAIIRKNNADGENVIKPYNREDSLLFRKKNLFFLGFDVSREIFHMKNRRWSVEASLGLQLGLNSHIDEESLFQDIYFVTDANLVDDLVSLNSLSFGLRVKYNAKYFLK